MNDWIKMRKELATDPAVSQIAAQCRLHALHVTGALYVVWCWADSNTTDGFVRGATAALVDRIAGRKGFAAAMAAAGWLFLNATDVDGAVGVRFPNWERHNSSSAKARAGEAERKRVERAGGGRVSARGVSGLGGAADGENVRTNGGHLSGRCPDRVRTSVRKMSVPEKRREENNNILCVSGVSDGRGEGDAGAVAEATETHTHEALQAWKERLAAQYPGCDIAAELRRAGAYVRRERGDSAPLTRSFFEQVWLKRVPQGEGDVVPQGAGRTVAGVPAVAIAEPEGWRECEVYAASVYGPGGESECAEWAGLPAYAQAAIAEAISKTNYNQQADAAGRK